MALSNTVSGTYTLDETSGIQPAGDGTPSGSPRDDSDISLAKLQADASAFYTYLFTTKSYSTSSVVGAAESSTTIINVKDDSGGTVSSIGFTDKDGNAFDGSQTSGLYTTSGHEIFLYSDLSNRVVYGLYDSDGTGGVDSVAFAVYMQPDAGGLDSDVNVQLFSVTFTAIKNTLLQGSDTQAYDDAVDLLKNVFVQSTGELHINFDNMPSGANLFNDAAESASGGGIIVFGMDPIVETSGKQAGKYTNESDYISTSQGGTGATIGVNSQMFNPGDGAYFTYVTDIVDTYLSGAKGGLSSTEADYAQNMRYDGGLIEAHTASIHISQIQDPNNPAGMTITAYDLNDDYQGLDLLNHRGGLAGGGDTVPIDAVTIYDSTHTNILESYANGAEAGKSSDITITINSDGVAIITGLKVADIVEWHTTDVHDQVLIQNTSDAGKFDVGGFDIREGSSDRDALAGHSFVEDDGPKIGNSDGTSAAIANAIVSYPGDTDGASATPPHTDVSSVTKTLGGAVGTDANSSPYDLTSWTSSVSFNGITLTAVPNTTSGPVTSVSYWQDTDGQAGIQSTDTKFYELSLNESGAGTYTFSVLKDPPVVEQHFGFGDQPSGQNLFGIIPGGPAVGSVVPEGGLLFFNSNVHLDSEGKYISSNSDPSLNSGTVNTSKGGGAVSIGYGANNYTAVGQNAFFVFADNPNTAAVSGMGLDATTADDADTVNFNGLNPTSIASVDIVKTVSSTEAGVTLKAWNLADAQMNMSDNNPVNETRDFLTDPLHYGTDATNVDITGVQVFRVTYNGQTKVTQLVYAAQDLNNDHAFVGNTEITTNTGNVNVSLNANGDVTVTGMDTNADYTIKYTTAAPHDMAEIDYATGSYNIGGFSRFTALDTPDRVLDFTARVTDGDGDTATASWHVGVDGTGVYDDGIVTFA